jgi:hypothetical protein
LKVNTLHTPVCDWHNSKLTAESPVLADKSFSITGKV